MRQPPTAVTTDRLLRTETVAQWLAVSKSTLVRWRQSGKGPDVCWLADGVPRYRITDIERWLAGRCTASQVPVHGRTGYAHPAR